MKYAVYSLYVKSDDLSLFDFVSDGVKGVIKKRATFMPTTLNGVYNLAFGDVNEENEIDDYRVTNNGDRNQILATIVMIVSEYTRRYPERWVYFRGSTAERTRLYRMAVGLNLEELSLEFVIYAEVAEKEDFVVFRKNMDIQAFLVRRKLVNL